MSPEQIDGRFVPAIRPSVASVEIDGETVIYDEATDSVHTLNATATVVWSCLDGAASLDELIGDLAAVYGSDPATVTTDVVALVRELENQGLLEGEQRNERADDGA